MGASVVVIAALLSIGDSDGPVTWGDLPFFVLIALTASAIGALYGALVGFVAGIGGVIAAERGRGRRVAVTGFALLAGALTVAVLALADGGVELLLPAAPYWVAMGVVAWFVAPRVDGQGRHG